MSIRKKNGSLSAIESRSRISQALDDWKTALTTGADVRDGLGGKILWHPDRSFWAHFGRSSRNSGPGWRYWNAFGKSSSRYRQNILVEINPPRAGIGRGTQGLLAIDGDGTRWILHGGRLHPRAIRISEEKFGDASGLKPVAVRFSNGLTRPYYPVANIDEAPNDVQASVARFVQVCERVRLFYCLEPDEAELERKVQEAEGTSSPERRGSYKVSARQAGIADRVHADVWQALADALDARQIRHTNARVGGYGPDLRTACGKYVLFEIKSNGGASSIYEATGQLLLYEHILGRSYEKVIVLPEPPRTQLANALRSLEISWITYSRRGSGIDLDSSALDARLTSRRRGH